MRGSDHIAISTGSGLLLAAPFLQISPVACIVFLSGTVIGSLLPDADATDSKLNYMDGIAQVFSLIMRPLIMPLTRLLFFLLRQPFDPGHRGSMHTIPGVLVYSLILSSIFAAILLLIRYWHGILVFFFFGLLFGGLLHILEDSCTKSGVKPFYPFSTRKYTGTISTGSRREERPGYYATALFIAGGGVIVTGYTHDLQVLPMAALSLALFFSFWMLIIWISRW
ncbi:MAG: metal-dependent hydrolase [Methanocalculus sp. MSAO_Arc1]|uniref:metal-dependent hydrolase n=1 Tax=Methanocalculus TaxID=71151 RepID=UPI000FF5DC65|nr:MULTISPECIES: metal-dependent hydrolase [unclassified Methanocalculus]MCP1662454.1 membrane-bound metal-dependent hydrolase YbcI (DUF457 family) [Methanocalculus sp. AMF5]RQD80880.1 MAG: metal-dependent hydrolase [Methanocalculus sp. MSAO_Arc1]